MGRAGNWRVSRNLLVIWAAAVLLSAQPASKTEGVYLAKPSDLPAWAETGNFRFIRIDGGEIETLKAERTWWGQNFNEYEKDVLTHIYNRDFDKMLTLLKQADYNWIWVTWSNGWTVAKEADNRRDLKTVIEKCHENGIKVTAYLSASNMFWWDMFRHEPRSRSWLLKAHGFPIPYGASPHRLLADVSKPEWRAYLVAKAAMAIDAGADAIFFDNVFGDIYQNKLLLAEVQKMAAEKAKLSGQPKVMVYENVAIGPGRFDLNDSGEVLWMESGKDNSGVWEDGWYVGNARKINYLAGAKQLWQPVMYENDIYHCGPRETCIPTPAEQKLSIAEAYALGAETSRNIEGRFLKGIITDEPAALAAWAAIGQYNKFVDDHRELYNRVTTLAKIALLSKRETNPLADIFIKSNVIYGSKSLPLLDKGMPLKSFKVLVIPFALGKLTLGQEKAFTDFAANGGKIFAAQSNAAVLEKIKANVTWIPRKTMFEIGVKETPGKFISQVNHAAGSPLVALQDSKYVTANLTRKDGADIFIVHFLNYDLKNAAEKIKVKVDLSGYAQDLSGYSVKLVSPDENTPQPREVSCSGSACEFSLPRVAHYAVVTIAR